MTYLCPLPGPVRTLRASFLVTLAVGDTHSLSDPLYSLYSACKRDSSGGQKGHQGAVWGCRGLGGGRGGLRSEKGAPVPHRATPSVRLTSDAGGGGYRDGGLRVAKDSMWAGAQRCPGSVHPSHHVPSLWVGGHTAVRTLLPGALGAAEHGSHARTLSGAWPRLRGARWTEEKAGRAPWAESSNQGSGAGRGRGPLIDGETEAWGW